MCFGVEDRGDDYYLAVHINLKMSSYYYYFVFYQEDELEGH